MPTPMKGRLFTILSVLSLVLCLVCVGMWVRSGFVHDTLHKWTAGGGQVTVASLWGQLSITVVTVYSPSHAWQPAPWIGNAGSTLAWPRWTWKMPSHNTIAATGFLGSTIVNEVRLPYWLLTLSAGILPGFWCWRRWKANRRQKAGLCLICGYDLRASPERCPECGTPVAPTPDSPRASAGQSGAA